MSGTITRVVFQKALNSLMLMAWPSSRTPGTHVTILPSSFPQTQCNFFFPLPNNCKTRGSAVSYSLGSRAVCTLTCRKAQSSFLLSVPTDSFIFTWYMGSSSIARYEMHNLHNLKRPTRHNVSFFVVEQVQQLVFNFAEKVPAVYWQLDS